jgi:hypothetical protein
LFIRCNDTQESPIRHYGQWDLEAEQAYPSIMAWLEAWCDCAVEAIEDGYFEACPDATTP